MSRLGIRDAHLRGLKSWTPGKTVVGPALTLQFMPKREDVYKVDEYADPEKQLHRHVLYHTQPGDIVVVDARGDLGSGVFGEMMLTYFMGRGGLGVVIDGCIRDYPKAKDLGLGLWLRGVTPNFHTQTDICPVRRQCARSPARTRWCLPGDIIVADDDGAVVVPASWRRIGCEGERARGVGGFLPHAPLRGRRPAELLPALRGSTGGIRGLARGPGLIKKREEAVAG